MRKLFLFLLLAALILPGIAAAQGASITITQPAAGSEVDIGTPFTVSGTASNLPADLTVRALDAANNVLAEQTLAADGAWSVSLTVNVAAGTVGSIYAFSINPTDSTVAAQSILNVTYGQGQLADSDGDGVPDEDDQCPNQAGTADNNGCPPVTIPSSITIQSPAEGATLSTGSPIVVSGSAAELPVETIIVQARASNGTVLAQQTTVPGGAGGWQVSLSVNVTASTPGNIYAFAQAGDGPPPVSDTVNVTFTPPAQGSPSVRITTPPNNADLNALQTVSVSGTAANLPANNVTVRAVDGANNILAEQTVAVSGGNWTAALAVNVTNQTRGTITAFAQANGTVIASSSISVTFRRGCELREDWSRYIVARGDTVGRIAQRTGSTVNDIATASCLTNANLIEVNQDLRVPPDPNFTPRVFISLPTQGTTLNVDQAILVTGVGRNLFEGSVVIRALDANNNILAQQFATITAPDLGDWGAWSVTLFLNNVQRGAPGAIFAFSTSPQDGRIVASELVNVTFGEAEVTPTPTPTPTAPGALVSVDVAFPASGSILASDVPFNVTGLTSGASVVARAIDSSGRVLAEQLADVTMAQPGQPNFWQTALTVSAPAGVRGTLYAYALSPLDGSIIGAGASSVVFGQVAAGPFVTIESPLPYAPLLPDAQGQIVVTGQGGQLPDGSVTVRALDSLGNVLAEQPALLTAQGAWEARLTVNTKPGTRGTLRAFAANPADRSVVASMDLPVIFGDAREGERYVQVNAPLPGSIINPTGVLSLAGYAGGTFNGTIILEVFDGGGAPLVNQPVSVDPTSGAWQASVSINATTGGIGGIRASITSPVDGAVIVSDNVSLEILPPPVPAATPGA